MREPDLMLRGDTAWRSFCRGIEPASLKSVPLSVLQELNGSFEPIWKDSCLPDQLQSELQLSGCRGCRTNLPCRPISRIRQSIRRTGLGKQHSISTVRTSWYREVSAIEDVESLYPELRGKGLRQSRNFGVFE